MGTLGGNLCLDTRCTYYNQSYEWRKAIDFCLKKDGETCWVATASKRCVAVSSTDTAPALIALGAKVKLVSAAGEREVAARGPLQERRHRLPDAPPDEILTEVVLPDADGWTSSYWKLRRRGSFDFPVLGVAAAVKLAPDGTVEEARIVLGAVASRPFLVEKAGESLSARSSPTRRSPRPRRSSPRAPSRWTTPTSTSTGARKWSTSFVGYALREVRGDDMRATRLRIARQAL